MEPNAMSNITTGITNLMTIVEGLFTSIVSNTYLLVIFSAGFVGLAARTIRKMVRASKSVG